ncbi:MAG: flagellar transcriptional regulator FlhC [Gammaproteobacteria bacterium]|nr:flagellar transcriptional regulator FlhC [Gammaproteobacteria bacterium]
MRLTDDRYSGERNQFELALRMIGHEARTSTIRECTGLSDDRIRKLFSRYFRDSGNTRIKRRRGKSPRQVMRYVKKPENQLQATTLVALYAAGRLIRIDAQDRVYPCWPRPDVEFGHRLCRAYETYCMLQDDVLLSFEWAWNLLQCIAMNDELYLAKCASCDARYVQDSYALDHRTCPLCATHAPASDSKPSR